MKREARGDARGEHTIVVDDNVPAHLVHILQGAQPEVVRAMWRSLGASHRNPR